MNKDLEKTIRIGVAIIGALAGAYGIGYIHGEYTGIKKFRKDFYLQQIKAEKMIVQECMRGPDFCKRWLNMLEATEKDFDKIYPYLTQ